MANISIKGTLGDGVSLPDIYDYASLDIASSTKSKIVIADEDGNQIVFRGDGLAVSGQSFSGGKVEKVQFVDAGKNLLASVDGKFNLAALSSTDIIDNFMIFAKGKDTITGSGVGDILVYGSNAGDDTIKGLGGNDFIQGSDGRNKIDGGAGARDVLSFEWVAYSIATGLQGLKLNLDSGKVVNAWGKTDKVSGIEDVRGTHLDDVFVGSDGNDYFRGMAGADTFTGGAGNDVFEFSLVHGSDTITDFDIDKDVILFGQVGGLDTFTELQAYMTEFGGSVFVDFDGSNRVEIQGTTLASLDAGNFEFAQTFA